jgi:hypothetical protein
MQPHAGPPGPLQASHHKQSLMLHDLIPGLDSGTRPGPLPTGPMFTATVNTSPATINTPASLIAAVNTPQSLTSIINTPQSHIAVVEPQPLAAPVNATQPQPPTISAPPVVDTNDTLSQFQPNIFQPHNPPSNNDNYMELAYQGGEAKVDRGDDVEAEIAASKKKKPNERKNQYYGNRTQPQHLWAKSAPEIVKKVDQTIRDNPKLGPEDRISILNSQRQRQWKELTEEEQEKWIKMAIEINSQTPDFGDTAYVLHVWCATSSNSHFSAKN